MEFAINDETLFVQDLVGQEDPNDNINNGNKAAASLSKEEEDGVVWMIGGYLSKCTWCWLQEMLFFCMY